MATINGNGVYMIERHLPNGVTIQKKRTYKNFDAAIRAATKAGPDYLVVHTTAPTQLPPPAPFHHTQYGRPAQSYYFNDSRAGIAIIAVQDAIGDWGAYIAASPQGREDEQLAYDVAVANGIKLPRSLAAAMFPDVPHSKWRR